MLPFAVEIIPTYKNNMVKIGIIQNRGIR